MSHPTRRAVARGAAWSIPAIAVASVAPAMAADPCSQIIKGRPLPASAFFAFNTSAGGTMNLTNGKSYALTGGTGVAGSGTAGTPNGGCSGPASSTAQDCNTYIGISLTNSSGTSSANPAPVSLSDLVTVDG